MADQGGHRKRPKLAPGITKGSDPVNDQKARDAGHMLLQTMLSLYASQKITARDFCLLAFYANAAGCPGADFAMYGREPDKQSGSYQDR